MNDFNYFNYDDISNIEKDVADIDFRKEYVLLNDEYGIDMLYIRTNKRTRCRCYNKRTKDGSSKCKICGGTGKVSIIEKVKGIYQNYDETGFERMTELGLSSSNTVIFYFDISVVPTVNDRIILVAYDRSTQTPIPVNISKSMIIISVDPIRGESGRIEVYKCFAKYTPEKIIDDQRRLNAIPIEDKKKLMRGVRYTWPQI